MLYLKEVVALILFVLTAVSGIHTTLAQNGVDGRESALGFEGASGYEQIFTTFYPDFECADAPTIFNGSGLTLHWMVRELPWGDTRTMEIRNRRLGTRPQTEMVRTFPTANDVRHLLSIADLDMADVLQYDDLLAAGKREELIALLTRLIDPKMDKYNKKALEAYDPALCVNEARSHVFRLRIDDDVLDGIRKAKQLFHRGRYEKYREKLMGYLVDYPGLSELHVGVGNSFFAEGDLGQARRWYSRGKAVNPLNPMLEYSMAFCHLVDGNADLAIECLIESIFACRNGMLAWLALDHLLSEQGRHLNDRRFRNQTLVNVDQSTVIVSKSVSQAVIDPWLYYGGAEIAAEHERGARWGDFDLWPIAATEMYKIAHLLGRYMVLKDESPNTWDSFLENLEHIYTFGVLKEYVLFDKIAPYTQYHLISTLPESERRKMREYFDRFIIAR